MAVGAAGEVVESAAATSTSKGSAGAIDGGANPFRGGMAEA